MCTHFFGSPKDLTGGAGSGWSSMGKRSRMLDITGPWRTGKRTPGSVVICLSNQHLLGMMCPQVLTFLGKRGREAPLHPSLPTLPLAEVLAIPGILTSALLFLLRTLLFVYKYLAVYILTTYHVGRVGYGFKYFNTRKTSIWSAMLRSQYYKTKCAGGLRQDRFHAVVLSWAVSLSSPGSSVVYSPTWFFSMMIPDSCLWWLRGAPWGEKKNAKSFTIERHI